MCLAILIAIVGLLTVFAPEARSPIAVAQIDRAALALFLHITASVAALLIGPLQLLPRIRARHIAIHRWMGRVYVTMVALGGIAGLVMAPFAYGGIVSASGFGALALAWLGTTALGLKSIREGAVAEHRRCMLRSYALTMAGVMLRIYLPIAMVAGAIFEPAYHLIAWLCWVPNLLLAELWLARRSGAGTEGARLDGAPRGAV